MESETGTGTGTGITRVTGRRLPVKTYHCRFCSHLLIASTRDFFLRGQPSTTTTQTQTQGQGQGQPRADTYDGETRANNGFDNDILPRRKSPGLDHAFIVPLPSRKKRLRQKPDDIEDSPDINYDHGSVAEFDSVSHHQPQHQSQSENQNQNQNQSRNQTPRRSHSGQEQEQEHLTLLLATTIPDAKPIIIRRAADDGFEKRRILRCGRCKVVIGYFIERDDLSLLRSRDRPRSSRLGKEKNHNENDNDAEEEKEEGERKKHGGKGKGEKEKSQVPRTDEREQELEEGREKEEEEEDEEDEDEEEEEEEEDEEEEEEEEEEADEDGEDDETKIIYILPGSLISTEDLAGVGGADILQEVMKKTATTDKDRNTDRIVLAELEREWKAWIGDTAIV